MSVKLKYQGKEKSRTKNQTLYRETLYGLQEEIDAYIATLNFGTYYTDKGFLTQFRKFQDTGLFWNVEITYTTTTETTDDTSEQLIGKQSCQLSVRNIQLPLQKHPNYKANWNHYFFMKAGTALPAFWSTTTSPELTEVQSQYYSWGDSPADVPASANGERWYLAKYPTMQGVECYDWALYVVTQTAQYRSATSAGNAIQKRINKITAPSEDFGIDEGNWKLDEVQVSYNGQDWIAQMVFTKSGDSSGWDTRLYSHE